MPVTIVKNQAQATQLGVPIGSIAPIIVPAGQDPQGMINDWSTSSLSNNSAEFAITWRPGGPNDYKSANPPSSSIYDAYGNFEYGATGAANGYSSGTLTGMGNALHGGSNNPINTTDINSGFNAVNNGGVIITVPVHYP
jgi:hypothetical protein